MKYLFFILLVFFQNCFSQGLKTNDDRYRKLPIKFSNFVLETQKLPAKIDLSAYTPEVISQGNFGTCVGVASAYMRTIMEAKRLHITEKKKIASFSFSPSYIYNAIKDSSDAKCKEGSDIGDALEFMKNNDLAYFSEQPYPFCEKNKKISPKPSSRILDYTRIFGLDERNGNITQATKKALAEGTPVLVGIQITPQLTKLSYWQRLWQKILRFFNFEHILGLWTPSVSQSIGEGHAICIVGYDDEKFGGAFHAINSYGVEWGDEGFFWIKYNDFFKYAKTAYQSYIRATSDTTKIVLSADVVMAFPYSENQQIAFQKNTIEAEASSTQLSNFAAYSITEPQQTNSSYRFSASMPQQAYLYIIAQNSTERYVGELFPRIDTVSALIAKNTQVYLPSKDSLYVLLPPTGVESVLFLFSENPLPIKRLVTEMNQTSGTFMEQVKTVLGDELVPFEEIKYKSQKIGFFLESGHKGHIVPLLITLKHVNKQGTF